MSDEYELVQTDADMTERPMEELDCRQKSLLSVGERSGQLRPYVRPVARRSPLAIMGVRLRDRGRYAGHPRPRTDPDRPN
jgi:hypothetical protein